MADAKARLMLADVVTLTRQFQRAVRLDMDVENIEALKGYICQGTARSVLESTARQIATSRHRAFTWTGPFGGGKSSLALALCSLVSTNRAIRKTALQVLGIETASNAAISEVFSSTEEGWLVLPIVGFRGSAINEIATRLDEVLGTKIITKTKSSPQQRATMVLETIAKEAEARKKNGVLLVIDELGKFLEASALEGDDIYFYQELADVISRCQGKAVVVGILHQSFEQYANRLSSELRDEWRKIQGRYIDIPLIAASDEVVELTGRAISSARIHPESLKISNAVAASIRQHRPGLSETFGQSLDRCWPLHPVTAALLGPVSKRRFGQNERSTFGFLASVEVRSLRDFLASTPANAGLTYTPSAYWDYLRANLEPSILSSPDSHRWSQSVEAVERTEQKQHAGNLHVSLVKTIALIDLFRNGSGLVASLDLLSTCVVDGETDTKSSGRIQAALEDLKRWAIILYKRHQGSWSITEGSDFDVDAALAKALAGIQEPNLEQLARLVRLRPVLAKRHYSATGTLRWMVPMLATSAQMEDTTSFMSRARLCVNTQRVESSAFGIVALVLPARNRTVRQAINIVRKFVSQGTSDLPLLIGTPRNGEMIRELGRELVAYEEIRRTRSELESDAVARRELEARTTEVRLRLEEELRDALSNVHWEQSYIGLDATNSDRPKALPQLVSSLADLVFNQTPHIFSELINRDSPSSNSVKARKDLLYAMLRGQNKLRLGIDGYPAEAGLYYNLLHVTGLHGRAYNSQYATNTEGVGFHRPIYDNVEAHRANTFCGMWAAAETLVFEGSKSVAVPELFRIWQERPFGVRSGALPVLGLAFILANQHRLAAYKDGMFLPQLREIDVDELLQDPGRFVLAHVKMTTHKEKILEGVSNHLKGLGENNVSDPLQAARALVSRIYDLPPWTLRTATLSERTRAVRDTIAKASDPYKILFVDLPHLFGNLEVSQYIDELGRALLDLSNAYGEMLLHVATRTLHCLDVSSGSTDGIEELRRRSINVSGISGNLQLDAFALRLVNIVNDTSAVEGLISLAVNKPPREWTDRDIDAALIQIADWAFQFRKVEAVSAVHDRPPTRNAIAVVFGTGKNRKLVTETFDVSPADDRRVHQMASIILKNLRDVRREVFLAALAEAGTEVIDSMGITGHDEQR